MPVVEINRLLKKSQKALMKKISHFTELMSEQIMSNNNSFSVSPDLSCRHFKAAQELANMLAPLWFIKNVTLFGSVSRGEQRPESDVDISVTIAPKKTADFMKRLIDRSAIAITENYPELERSKRGDLFHLVALTGKRGRSDFFEKMRFFETGYSLGENATFRFELDKGKYSFEKESVIGYTNNLGWGVEQLVLYPRIIDPREEESGLLVAYNAVLISDFIPIALFSVRVAQERPNEMVEEQSLDDYSYSFANTRRSSFKDKEELENDLWDTASPFIDKVLDSINVIDLMQDEETDAT